MVQAGDASGLTVPTLLSDAEILSSIKSTMTRKQTMSLPLHLLKGNPSMDALENALRAESAFFPRAQSIRRRMASGSQVLPHCPELPEASVLERPSLCIEVYKSYMGMLASRPIHWLGGHGRNSPLSHRPPSCGSLWVKASRLDCPGFDACITSKTCSGACRPL